MVTDICHVLNVQDDELKSKISALLEDNKKLKKYNSSLLKDLNYLKIIEIVSNKNLILIIMFTLYYMNILMEKF